MTDQFASAPESSGPDPFLATADGARHAANAALAAAGPVRQVDIPGGRTGWLVVGHAAAREALTHPHIVKGGPRFAPFADRLPDDVARGLNLHMLYLDPPDHTRLRRLVAPAFTRARVERLTPYIQVHTNRLLDAMAETETADLLSALAYPLPIAVLNTLMGGPPDAQEQIRDWVTPLMSPFTVGYTGHLRAAREFLDHVRALISQKQENPGTDLLSDLVALRDGTDRLSEDELTAMMFLLLVGGHETTASFIGNSVRALLLHPEQLAVLRAEPQLWPQAIEELLRYDGPAQTTIPARTAAPVTVAGVDIPENALVLVSLLAVNRDETQFKAADQLDIGRGSGGHLAFGHGIHHCLGAPLARLEAGIVLPALFDRFPDLRLDTSADALEWKASVVLNGLDTLPVRLR